MRSSGVGNVAVWLKGFLPCKVEGRPDNKTFTIRVQDENGQVNDVQYSIHKDARGYLKVSAPNDASKEKGIRRRNN